jgi:hypothetical protein
MLLSGRTATESALLWGAARMAASWTGRAPFRAPHHTCSEAGLFGCSKYKKPHWRPGELALAHGGVLYLDELENWRGSLLQRVAKAHADGGYSTSIGWVPFKAHIVLGMHSFYAARHLPHAGGEGSRLQQIVESDLFGANWGLLFQQRPGRR